MRPTSLAARKAGAALTVLMLSTALAACQPNGSTDATAPTTTTTVADQTSNPTDSSTTSPTDGGSADGSTSDGSATTGSTTGSQGDAPRGLESFYNQTIDWQDCPDGASFKCGTVTVPVDYDHPDGHTITLAVKKLPALDGDAEHGSLFNNPGGPGLSGIEPMKDPSSMPESLRTGYDMIGFDPRGVGQSTPITCWSEDEIKQYLANPNDPNNPANWIEDVTSKNMTPQEKFDRGASNAARCAQHSQVPELLDHVGTRDVARDLDVLRATNGNAKLNYLGTSYGTYIGALYADLFPGRVGRIVLNGAMDPSKRSTDESVAEQVAFKEGVLRQYVEHCQAQSACPLTGSTDEAVAQLAAFVNGLDKNPLTTPDSDTTVNTMDATVIIQELAVAQPDWEALTAMLTPAMTNHDGTLMAKAKQNLGEAPPTTVEAAVSAANAQVMRGAVTCNDDPDTGTTASDWDTQAAAERKAHPFFGGTSNAAEAYCRGWGHRGTTPPQETRAEGSAPILVIGITGDIQTLYSWSQSLASQLDNGHLLTVQGYGHGTFACARPAAIDFLVNGTVPADGATCTAEPKPTGAEPQPAAGGAEG